MCRYKENIVYLHTELLESDRQNCIIHIDITYSHKLECIITLWMIDIVSCDQILYYAGSSCHQIFIDANDMK